MAVTIAPCLAPTSLPRFVDGFIGLHDMDESRRLDQEIGLLAHGSVPSINIQINKCHSLPEHLRDLQYKETDKGWVGLIENRRRKGVN